MSNWNKLRKNHINFLITILGDLVVYFGVGIGWLFGPKSWHSGQSLTFAAHIVPIPVLGALMIILGIVMIVGLLLPYWCVIKYTLCAGTTIFSYCAIMFIIALFAISSAGIAGPFLWGAFAIHQIAQSGEPPDNPATYIPEDTTGIFAALDGARNELDESA